jgi:hypothetical protein
MISNIKEKPTDNNKPKINPNKHKKLNKINRLKII